MELVKKELNETPEKVIEKIKKNAAKFNFIIRDVFNMAQSFKERGVDIAGDFVYYSVMLCNPKKAYAGISNNKIRGAILLPPKQVVVYPEGTKTIIAYVKHSKQDVANLLPDDEGFQEGLSESCDKIEELIREVVVDGKI